jgi:hypothetical protein
MCRACSTNGGEEDHVGYWWEIQKERELGRQRRRWVYNITMDLRKIGWYGLD